MIRLFLCLLAAAALLAGCGSGSGSRPSPTAPISGRSDPGACLVVDTDAGIGDFRALAALFGRERIAAIVVTEGVAQPAAGAMAVAHLLGAANLPAAVPVVVGAASGAPPDAPWLIEARGNAEALNGFLAKSVPMLAPSVAVEDEVERLTRGCAGVRVIQLAPWSSFVRYAPRLGTQLRQVIAEGRPLEESAPPAMPSFTCQYDAAACRQANDMLKAAGTGLWVDVPGSATPAYEPTAEMADALSGSGLPGTVQAVLRANPTAWESSLLWDDAAVLFQLRPDLFESRGRHVEPRVPPDALRRAWIDAVNGAR